MIIEKLDEFAKDVDSSGSNTEGLDLDNGFPTKLQPARQWFNWLFNKITKKVNEVIDSHNSLQDGLINKIYPIGVVISFGVDFDPNTHFQGTTWIRHGEGRASVGQSTKVGDPAWVKNVGSEFGEYSHKLGVNELPKFKAETVMFRAGYVPTDGDWTYLGETSGFANDSSADSTGTMKSKVIGGDVAHNVVQPSIIEARWRRTA